MLNDIELEELKERLVGAQLVSLDNDKLIVKKHDNEQ